jgi:protease PrsW
LGGKFVFVLGLVAFVVLAKIIELMFGISKPVSLGPKLAAVMALVPAALWLGYFYLWDRYEPEPRHLVAGVFALGVFIAAPLADFVMNQAVPPIGLENHGKNVMALDRVIFAVLIYGLAQEVCKYATVRYTMYPSPQFNEPMDGVVYMMAVGTGFAVWVNYHRLSSLGNTVYLSIGAAKVVVTTLAHASFAGVLGYVMGRSKFSKRSAPVRGVMLFVGLLGAAVLNGAFTLAEQYLSANATLWQGVGFAALVAGSVFALLWLLSQRLLAVSPFRRAPE